MPGDFNGPGDQPTSPSEDIPLSAALCFWRPRRDRPPTRPQFAAAAMPAIKYISAQLINSFPGTGARAAKKLRVSCLIVATWRPLNDDADI
jgi:hypothetical protein